MDKFRIFIVAVGFFILPSMASAQIFVDSASRQKYETLRAKYDWKDLSIEIRPLKYAPADGFEAKSIQDTEGRFGQTFYVGPEVIVAVKSAVKLDILYQSSNPGTLSIVLTFDTATREKLQDYTTKHMGEHLGILIDGKLRTIADIKRELSNGKTRISRLSPQEATSIADRFNAELKQINTQVFEEMKKNDNEKK